MLSALNVGQEDCAIVAYPSASASLTQICLPVTSILQLVQLVLIEVFAARVIVFASTTVTPVPPDPDNIVMTVVPAVVSAIVPVFALASESVQVSASSSVSAVTEQLAETVCVPLSVAGAKHAALAGNAARWIDVRKKTMKIAMYLD